MTQLRKIINCPEKQRLAFIEQAKQSLNAMSFIKHDSDESLSLHASALSAYKAKQYNEALELIQKAIACNPDKAEIYNTYGLILEAVDKYDQALKAYKQAVSIDPFFAKSYVNIATVLIYMNRFDESEVESKKAIQIKPDCAEAYNTLGYALQMQGKFNQAIENYNKAVSFKSDFAEAYYHLGEIFSCGGFWDAAAKSYRMAIRSDSNYVLAHNNLGHVLNRLGDTKGAIECLRRALEIDPDFAEGYFNLANTLRDQCDLDQAIQNYQRAIEIKPCFDLAKFHLSHALLLSGDFEQGWHVYDWWKCDLKTFTYPAGSNIKSWNGSNFVGQRLLVLWERGFGDNIQYLRYLPMVKACGGTVILEAPKQMLRLLKGIPGVDELVEASEDHNPSVQFDIYTHLLGLSKIFNTRLDNIPAEVPYICANPGVSEHWAERICWPGLKVGIVWAGLPTHGNDHNRSCNIKFFEPMTRLDGVKLYGLQKGPAAKEAAELSNNILFENLGPELIDFADTAGVIANLDLVISVDTAVLHLAAAMAKPTWALLPFSPDWRWMLNRDDSPWYPAMKLFRQNAPGCWNQAFERVTVTLKELADRSMHGHSDAITVHQVDNQQISNMNHTSLSPVLTDTRNRNNHKCDSNPDEKFKNYSDLQHCAIQAYQNKQLDQALDYINKAVEYSPDIPELRNTQGIILEAVGSINQAIEAYERAIELKPDYTQAFLNLAVVLGKAGRFADSVKNSQKALSLQPNCANAFNTLGYALQQLGKIVQAAQSYREAIRFNPKFAEPYNHLGTIFNEMGLHEDAEKCYKLALKVDPQYSEAHNNLGVARRDKAEHTQSIICYKEALRLDPDFAEAHYNLANTLRDLGKCDEAIGQYKQAIELKPDYPEAHWNLSLAYLLSGKLEQGWKLYGWRRHPSLNKVRQIESLGKSLWNGTSFQGQRLLVHCEQGFGDTIQFIRYLPMVKARGGTVILELQKELMNLAGLLSGYDELVQFVAGAAEIPVQYDLYISLLDLPGIFGTTLENIPANIPYIYADQDKVEKWGAKLGGAGLKVGIAWAGSATHGNDKNRSCELALFESLANIPNINLYGLQCGDARQDFLSVDKSFMVENLGTSFCDFADTAAVIENIDLVISVDTAVLHLAAAMGKPVWALIPFAPDWRWMLDRQDTPWYPTARLYRQSEWGHWQDVFKRVAVDLRLFGENRKEN